MARRFVSAESETPVPPREFDPDAAVYALHAKMTNAPDATEWERKSEITTRWASDNGVELHPEHYDRVTEPWVWDDERGRVDFPTATGRVETVRRARQTQNGRVSATYRTVIDTCPRCTETHSFLGALRDAVAYPACGVIRVVVDGSA